MVFSNLKDSVILHCRHKAETIPSYLALLSAKNGVQLKDTFIFT